MTIFLRLTVLGAILFTAVGAESPSDIPASTVWGRATGGIQCGLGMLPSELAGRLYNIRLTIRNVGPSTVSFTDGEIRDSALHLVAADSSARFSRAWSTMDGEDPRLNIPIGPGQTTGITFSALKSLAGSSVMYDGALTPIGARSGIALRCGPIDF